MLFWHLYLMGLLLIIAGMNHFRTPKIYERIIPPYIPAHSTVVLLSGILEMILGLILLNKESSHIAAWGIIILLIIFIPVHIYMLQNEKASLNLPKWVLIIRFPLQLGLIFWAFLYT